MTDLKRSRPTIGILPGYSTLSGNTPDHYRSTVLQGIYAAACLRECNLLLGWSLRQEIDQAVVHPAGDKVIQNLAICMKEERRSTDGAARIGGEEFALILPGTDLEGARFVAEKSSKSSGPPPVLSTRLPSAWGSAYCLVPGSRPRP